MKELLLKLWETISQSNTKDVSTYNAIKGLNDYVDKSIGGLSLLKTDSPVSATLQAIKDKEGAASSLQISTDVTKAAKTLIVGEVNTASGTITLLGSLSGQTFYDRLWDGSSTPTIFSFYCNDGSFNLYKQVGGSGADILSFAKTSGYGKFINGTLYASKTTAEINAIVSPVENLTFWNSTLKTLCFYNGTSWQNILTYKSYIAVISQNSTDAPTAVVLNNTLGGTVVWSRTALGQYTATLVGGFTANKTACFVSQKSVYDMLNTYDYTLESQNADEVILTTWLGGAADDNVISGKIIEIRVYN